ncbi:maleylacetoacetate isomerase [Rhodopila sp.]|uniref:maleylacetoacetate isomerase n=1 Tax=Rhodopila sp. TaxID=2480087 RepID=UPI003D0A5A52
MIKMYGFWRSAASFRVRIALHLKGLAFEEQMIDLDADEQNAPAYRAVNPQAAVPTVIFDAGPRLTQSLAILEYLEETHPTPALLPPDPAARARVRSLALLWAADHHPLIVPRIRGYLADVMHQDEASRAGWIRHWFREGLAIGERRLAGDPETGDYCHRDTPTIADLCLFSQAIGARGFGVDFSDLAVVSRIVETCLARDEFARSVPLRQPGAPARH